MPTDRAISTSVGCLVSYALWGLTVTFMLAGTVHGSFTVQNWGLVTSAAAATVTIRQYFVKSNRMMRTAFELAKDAARADLGDERTPTPIRPR